MEELLRMNGFQVKEMERIAGGYAATLYRVRYEGQDGRLVEAVYKHFAQGRAQELVWYEKVVPRLPYAVPRLLGVVKEAGVPVGMMLEEAGVALKGTYRRGDLLGKKGMLRGVLGLLAEMHVRLAGESGKWLEEGIVGEYSYESSEEWAGEALRRLESVVDWGIGGVTGEVVRELKEMAGYFYPRYRGWVDLASSMGGRTLTHGDPHLENVLVKDGEFRLIDWEWACVAVPQRDLAVVLQDVLEEEVYEWAIGFYREEMRKRGWGVGEEFEVGLEAVLFDNTLMMLGWEMGKYIDGYVSLGEMEEIVGVKVGRMRGSVEWLVGR